MSSVEVETCVDQVFLSKQMIKKDRQMNCVVPSVLYEE